MVGTISKRAVDALAPGERRYLVWDRALPRFGVAVQPSGVKSYVVQYRHRGRLRRYVIGQHGRPWTADGARDEALRVLGRVASGEDPASTKEEAREADALTVRAVVARFLRDHVEAKRKAWTLRSYRRLLEAHVLPVWGARPVGAIEHADVAKLHHRLRATPMAANRTVAVLSKMFMLCETWKLRTPGTNPCRGIERYPETERERYLTPDELARLGAVLDAADRGELGALNPYALAGIKLLLFTGARAGEVLGLRWQDVDLDRGIARLPDSKTGKRTVVLNAAALAVLRELPRVESNEHVLVGGREGQHLVNLKDTWSVIRRAATLDDVRLHDLRHAYASVAVLERIDLRTIGGLLGHKRAQTTKRYAHVHDAALHEAAERIGERIAAAMAVTPTAPPATAARRTHCACCKTMLAVSQDGALCQSCASGRCRRGRTHRRTVVDVDGRARKVAP